MDFIPNLQALRAFAALNVVVFHAMVNAKDYFGPLALFDVLQDWGGSGVDIFFVLSGFIILHSQFKPNFSLRHFAYGRVTRILPVYYFVTALVIGLFFLLPSLFREADYQWSHIFTSFAFVSQLVLGQHPIVGYGWTLEYEMVFYLVFGLLAAFGPKDAWLFCALLFAISLGLVFGTFIKDMFFEFVFEALIGALYRSVPINRTIGMTCLTLGAIGLFVAIFWKFSEFRVLHFGLPATLLVLGAVWSRQISNKSVLLLGAASYSIYLVQMLTVPGTMKMLEKLDPNLWPTLAALIAVVVTALVGIVLYFAVERSSLSFFRKHASPVSAANRNSVSRGGA